MNNCRPVPNLLSSEAGHLFPDRATVVHHLGGVSVSPTWIRLFWLIATKRLPQQWSPIGKLLSRRSTPQVNIDAGQSGSPRNWNSSSFQDLLIGATVMAIFQILLIFMCIFSLDDVKAYNVQENIEILCKCKTQSYLTRNFLNIGSVATFYAQLARP